MFELKRLFRTARVAADEALGDGAGLSDAIRVLAITRSPDDDRRLREIAADAGWELSVIPTAAEASRYLDGRPLHIVICDRDLADEDWRAAMTGLARRPQVACVLLASTVSDEYLWDEVIQCRGYDVVLKPFQAEELRRTVKFAWSWRRWSSEPRSSAAATPAATVRRKSR